jgi:opacity protein-like surface antigen
VNRSLPRIALHLPLSLLLATLGATAHADGLRLSGGAGSSDYGTALKAQLNQGFKLSVLPGTWRWEAQVTSFGNERYQQFANTYKRSAWAVGASALPEMALTPTLAAYGKLGLHHLHSEASGPGLNTSVNKIRFGVGAGLRWQVLPKLGLRVEAENIGGSGGDLLTVGAEVPL